MRVFAQKNHGYRCSFDLFQDFAFYVAFISTVNRVQQMTANKFDINILVPAKQMEAFCLVLICMLI